MGRGYSDGAGPEERPPRAAGPALSSKESLLAVRLAACCSQPWLLAAGAGGVGPRGLGFGCLPPGALRVGAGLLGLHQGEGRPVIKSGGPSRAEAGLERGEAESVCSCGRNGSGVEGRICAMRWLGKTGVSKG